MRQAISMLAAVTLLLTVAGPAKADIIFNDYGPAYTDNASGWSVGLAVVNQWSTASQFTASITASVTQIDIGLSLISGTNAAVVDLMEDANGAPGAILETYDFDNQMGPFGVPNPPLVATSTSHPILYADTTYWLTVFPPSPTANTAAAWNFNNQDVIGLIDQSTNNGATWFPTGGGGSLGAFEIFGSPLGSPSPTPEPASLTLLVGGISTAGGLGLLKRRRQKA
jgi:hypothetical protein